MALNHVAERAGSFVKTAAPFDAKRFASGDLHMIHVVTVPERFENSIAEAQDEQILNCVLAEVVVDTVNLPLLEYALHHLVEFFRGGKVAAKRFFDNHANP